MNHDGQATARDDASKVETMMGMFSAPRAVFVHVSPLSRTEDNAKRHHACSRYLFRDELELWWKLCCCANWGLKT